MKGGGSGAAAGHARKHTHAHKHVHHKHPKHHPKHQKTAHHHHHRAKAPHTVGRHPAPARGLALSPSDVACCVSQALAASLHLQGLPVTGADVLALHRAAGADDEQGAPILAVLEAASESGIAGLRLARFDSLSAVAAEAAVGPAFAVDAVKDGPAVGPGPGILAHPVILGLDLPGPHTVLATPEGWWSWGSLWCPWCDFPDAVVDEAWAVSWR